jgi:hypothetical protein
MASLEAARSGRQCPVASLCGRPPQPCWGWDDTGPSSFFSPTLRRGPHPGPPAQLLFAALEVLGVSRAHVHPLEIPNEDLFELCPATDAVVRQEFEPCSDVLPDTDAEVLDNEVVNIRSSGSTSEPEVFHTYSGVHLLSVLGDVSGSQKHSRNGAFWM